MENKKIEKRLSWLFKASIQLEKMYKNTTPEEKLKKEKLQEELAEKYKDFEWTLIIPKKI